ncbi:MAG: amino acid ABC transporter permease [Candidatus Borkfalkiaceae bacterium]|nr:amino acid ABC transporter permease [Clostridia bacterium]MDY6223834.1 amino acid ABC transporter permease [Christensenellaceae bacterium]
MFASIKNFFIELSNDFLKCFIENSRYLMYLKGLRNTIFIAVGACILGLIIGIAVTCIRIMPKKNPLSRFFDRIARLYVTVIRGTPVVLQLFICYFVILKSLKSTNIFNIPETNGIPIAIIAFGLNSGAYMAEILRGGINAVDGGQMEAGRTLGLSWMQTFFKIVLPQALKSAIPTMFNEFITLVKETSVAGYVGIVDLTKIQTYITVQTMQLYMPLFIIAAIYLIIVLGLQKVQKIIEERLKRSER